MRPSRLDERTAARISRAPQSRLPHPLVAIAARSTDKRPWEIAVLRRLDRRLRLMTLTTQTTS